MISQVYAATSSESLGEMDPTEFDRRLSEKIRSLPGVTDDTEIITLFVAGYSEYRIHLDGNLMHDGPLSERLHQIAEDAFNECCAN